MATATRSRLYGREHRLTQEALAGALGALEAIRGAGDPVLRIAVGGNEILVNDRALPVVMGPTYSLARRLSAKGIGLIELQAELGRDELLDFCVALADPATEVMRSQSHLRLGEAMVLPRGVGSELEALRVQNLAGGRADAVPEEVKLVQSLAVNFAENREVRFQDADELVYQFLARMGQEENLFLHLAEVREHNLFTYLHTTNVATLTMGFALRLGLRDRAVHELGVAALLHDLGKSLVPATILNKPGKLTAEEWTVIERHPVDGASLLVRNPEVPRLAVVSLLIGFAFLGRPVSVTALTVALAVPTVLAAGVAMLITRLRGNGPRTDLGLIWSWHDVRVGVAYGVCGLVITIPASLLYVVLVGPGAGQLRGRRRVRGVARRTGGGADRRARRRRAGAVVRGDRLPRACCGGRWSATRCPAGCRSW